MVMIKYLLLPLIIAHQILVTILIGIVIVIEHLSGRIGRSRPVRGCRPWIRRLGWTVRWSRGGWGRVTCEQIIMMDCVRLHTSWESRSDLSDPDVCKLDACTWEVCLHVCWYS